MTPTIILGLITVFFAGMLAGSEFVIHYGIRLPAEVLDDRSQLQLRQALVKRLRVMIPAFFAPTAILGITLTVISGTTSGFGFRYAAVAALLLWVMIRVVGTVPINSATLSWQLNAPPANWKAQINHAERFHIIGVWAAVLAFVFFLSAVALTLAA